MDIKYPKVLILNQPFNNDTGGGVTISNLFSNWSREKIAVVCQSYLFNNSNLDKCSHYYQLGHKEHKYTFPLNLIKRKHYSGPLKFNQLKKGFQEKPKSKFRNNLIFRLFIPLLKYSGLFNAVSRTKLTPELCNWLDKFNPDIIYAQASSRESILFILQIHSYLKKPLVFHMMDDWPSLKRDKGPFGSYWRKIIDRDFKTLLNSASLLMSISHSMAEEYHKRYNKLFVTFQNPIDLDFWKRHQKANYEFSGPPSILYAGRIGLGINSSLETIAKVIQALNEEFDLSIRFKLQTREKPSWILKYSCVEHFGYVQYENLPQVLSTADILIIPYDFSKESINYIRYSMPTKVPEYMISGVPIIVFAPESSAIVKYAHKYKWAKIVSNNNAIELSKAISELINCNKIRQQLGQNAILTAEANHSSLNVANRFRDLIFTLVPKVQVNA